MKHVLALRHLTLICMRIKSNGVLFLSLNKVKKYFYLIIIIIMTSSYNFINEMPFFSLTTYHTRIKGLMSKGILA
jgi:hypothetical protein